MNLIEEYKTAQAPRWILRQKYILDEAADALICSANVNLMLTGGVGAEMLTRCGRAMQSALQEKLRTRSPRCAKRGEILPYVGPEIPYKVVLHAVAIDGWYESTPEVITDMTRRALQLAAQHGAKKVTLTALVTGFGRLSFAEFAQGVRPILKDAFLPIEEVVICLRLDFRVAELRGYLPEIDCVTPLNDSPTQ